MEFLFKGDNMKGRSSMFLFKITFLVIFCLCSTSCIDDKCTQGDWKNGFGTSVYTDGRKYVGEYRDNKWHGQGTLTYTDGGKYVGELKDDKWHGKGTLTLADGTKFVGEFRDGKMLPKGREQ